MTSETSAVDTPASSATCCIVGCATFHLPFLFLRVGVRLCS
jgi:hypothetical protein